MSTDGLHSTPASTATASAAARPGALLPTVLAVMVIIGFAASAALFMTRQEREASQGVHLEATAGAATDEAQAIAMARLSSRAHTLAIGESFIESIPLAPGVNASARLIRLGEALFVLAVESRAQDESRTVARRGTSVLLRLDVPGLGFPAALSLVGDGSAPEGIADGGDHVPHGWPCASDGAAVPHTLHPLASAGDSVVLSDLRDRAAITLVPGASVSAPGPVVSEGECQTSVATNWGDAGRAGPCGSWFPIVHAAGDVTVNGGAGQGVLVVDGDLTASGGFTFVGAVVVTGELRIGSGGTLLSGGVRAGGVIDVSGGTASAPAVVYASCALHAALLATAPMVLVRDRPWAPER